MIWGARFDTINFYGHLNPKLSLWWQNKNYRQYRLPVWSRLRVNCLKTNTAGFGYGPKNFKYFQSPWFVHGPRIVATTHKLSEKFYNWMWAWPIFEKVNQTTYTIFWFGRAKKIEWFSHTKIGGVQKGRWRPQAARITGGPPRNCP
jgi:hypothetical protein